MRLDHPFRSTSPGAPLVALALIFTLAPAAADAQGLTRTGGRPAPDPAAPAWQQVRTLTVDEALALAETRSEQVQIAEAGVTRAESEEVRARSEWLPQVSAAASYDRALASEFDDVFDVSGPACTPFTLNPGAPLADRVAEIERALRDCPPTGNLFGGGGGDDAGDGDEVTLPFGRPNTYRVTFLFAQNVYTGGRLTAQREQARLGRASAGLALSSARAQVALDVAQAYYDAVLSDRLVAIAEATLAQAERTAEQVRLQRAQGRLAEFDLVRALVARDAQRPEVIRGRNARDLAYLRLKQLLELPLDVELQLVDRLEDPALPPPSGRLAPAISAAEAGEADARGRTAIAQAENDVRLSEAAVRIARSQRLPSVSLSSSYGRVAFPLGFDGFGDWRTNWTIGLSAQVPLFTGGRIRADEMAARATVSDTQARLRLTRELATLDAAAARLELANARAVWQSTAGTVQQAERAYEIAELRYREGVSTQLELSDARLLLQQAQASQVLAARDVQVARVRLALLPDLPLTTASPGTAAPAPASQTRAPAAPGPSPAPGAGTSVGASPGAAAGRTGGGR